LNGVALHIDIDGKLIAVSATDGYQLLCATVSSGTALQVCSTVVLSKNDIKLINLKYPLLDVNGFDGVTIQQLKDIIAECELIDGRYPDITRVIPKIDRQAKLDCIGLNVNYLANISKIHKALKTKQYTIWAFNFASASDSMTAKQRFEDIECNYVLMPARI